MNDRDSARAALAAAVASGAMIAQQVAGRATRDALFLASFDAAHVPKVLIAGASLSLVAVLALARALTRYGPARVVPATFAASAALLVAEWALSRSAPAPAAVALHLHVAIFGAAVISAFWSLVNERFDPHTAKVFMGRIAGGGTAGGVLGGLVAWRAGGYLGAPTMMLVMAGANVVSAWMTRRLGAEPAAAKPADTPAPSGAPAAGGLRALREVRHLRDLALLVGLGAASAALFDVALGTQADRAFTTREELLSFFALFHLVTGVLAFVLQAAFARGALAYLGLAGTVALLPGAVLAGAVAAPFVPGLWAAALVRGAEAVLKNSLFRSGYELLYTPLPAEQKRSVKALVDVGSDRIGTVAGSAAAILALALAPASLLLLIGLGAGAAAICLLFVPRLHRSYVDALRGSLQSGAVALDLASVVDATTRRTLSGTIDALDRQKILAEIAALRKSALPPSVARPEGDAALSAREAHGAPDERDPLIAAIADLRSADPERARKALGRPPEPALVAHVLPLLAQRALVSDVVRALRAVAPQATGQLVDALLDPDVAFAIRRRIPRVLQACPTQRAADGLLLGLADDRFEVRYECGVALARLLQHGAAVTLRREDVVAAAQREIDADRRIWDAQPHGAAQGDDRPGSMADRLLVERTSRSLEHVFRVLSLSLDRQPLEIAYRALHAGDARLRGTALEYLENVLPEPIRERLWPYLGERRAAPPGAAAGAAQGPARATDRVRDELLRSADALTVGPLSIRRMQRPAREK